MKTVRQAVIGQPVWKDGLPVGMQAACPICGVNNLAKFDETPPGALCWWPDGEAVERGEQCRHFLGFYASGQREPVGYFG